MNYLSSCLLYIALACGTTCLAQAQLTTGGHAMPNEWIDAATGHKIIKLTRMPGSNRSFYFHNQPFIDEKMVFYNTVEKHKQLCSVDLQTLELDTITSKSMEMAGEIAGGKAKDVYYQINDSVFATNIYEKNTRLVFVFPLDFKANVSTLNVDGTILAGKYSSGEEERKILKQYPDKGQYFERIFEAKIQNTLFTIDLKSGTLKKIYTENTWLGHVQFSPADPHLLMFCHEGPWHKVDRIWTIDIGTQEVKKIHHRTMDMEIAGHEFFSRDGAKIWYDLQLPKGKNFYLASTDLRSGKLIKYKLKRDEWSIHFNISPDETLFAGDGGDSSQVAKSKNGQWIYLFRPEKNKLKSEKLVSMKHHDYKLEPNVHFSPDGKWVIFRANFEGESQVYAVEVDRKKD